MAKCTNICSGVVLVLLPFISISVGQSVCPDGWERFHESCYFFADEILVDWTGAGHFCDFHHEAKLAVIESKEEDLMLTDHLHHLYKPGSDHNTYFWLGASDSEIEGIWQWYTTDVTFSRSYANWHPGQPDSSDHNTYFWLGASDSEIEGIWKWYTTDVTFSRSYANWHPGQPDNSAGSDCLCYWGPRDFTGWHDYSCNNRNGHAICEKNMTRQTDEIIG